MSSTVSKFTLLLSGGVSGSLKGAFSQVTASTSKLKQQLESVNQASKKIDAFKSLNDQLDKLRTKMAGGGKRGVELQERLGKIAAEARQVGEEYRKQTARLEKLKAVIAVGGGELKEIQTDFKKTTMAVKKLGAQYDRLKQQQSAYRSKFSQYKTDAAEKFSKTSAKLRELSSELKKAGLNMNDLAGAEKRLAAQTDRTNRQLSRLGKAAHYRDMRQNAFAGFGGLVGSSLSVAAPVKVSMDFEESMAGVRKVVPFKGIEEQKAFERDIMRLSTKIPISHKGLLAISESGGQLGVAKDKLIPFTSLVGKMSTAFDMAPSRAGKAMAKMSNVYQIPITDLEILGDAVNHLSDNTAASASEMVEAMVRMGGVAKQFGLTEVQTAALANSMIALGKAPEVAARGFNFVLSTLQAADIQPDRVHTALEMIGYSAKQLKEDIGRDAQGALIKFFERLAKVPKMDRASILGRLFGREWSDEMAVFVESLGGYKKALELVNKKTNYAGSMQREFENRNDTTRASINKLQNRIVNFATILGSTLLPAIRKISDSIGEWTDKLIVFTEKYPKLTSAIAKLTSGTLAGIAGLSAMGMVFKFVAGGLGQAFYLLQAFASVMFTTPLGLAAVGIVALGVALHKLGVLEPLVKGFVTSIKSIWPAIKTALLPGIKALKAALSPLKDTLDSLGFKFDTESWESIGKFLGDLIGLSLVQLAENISAVAKALAWLGETFGKVGGALSMGDFSGAFREPKIAFKPLEDIVDGGLITLFGENLFNHIVKPLKDLVLFIGGFLLPPLKLFGPDNAIQAGKSLDQLGITIKEKFNSLRTWFKELSLIGETGKLIESMSSPFDELWKKIKIKLVNAWNSIKNWWNSLSLFDANNKIAESITSPFDGLGTKIKTKLGESWRTVKVWWNSLSLFETDNKMLESIPGSFDGLGTRLRNKLGESWKAVKTWWNSLSLFEESNLIIKSITDPFKGLGTKLENAFSNAWKSVTAWFNNLSLVDEGKKIMDKLAQGIVTAPGSIYKSLSDRITGVFSELKFWESDEPRKTNRLGQNQPQIPASAQKSQTGGQPQSPGNQKGFMAGASEFLSKTWESIKGFIDWQEGIKAVSQALSGIGEAIGGSLVKSFQTLKQWLGDLLTGFTDFSIKGLDNASRSIGDMAGLINNKLGAAFDSLKLRMKETIQGWTMFGQTVVQQITTAFNQAEAIIDGFLQKIASFGPRLTEAFKSAWGEVSTYLNTVDLSTTGAKIMGTLAQGIRSEAGQIKGAVKSALATIEPLKAKSDAKEGPLSDLTAWGQKIPATIALGITSRGRLLPQAMIGALAGVQRSAAGLDFPELPRVFHPIPRPRPDVDEIPELSIPKFFGRIVPNLARMVTGLDFPELPRITFPIPRPVGGPGGPPRPPAISQLGRPAGGSGRITDEDISSLIASFQGRNTRQSGQDRQIVINYSPTINLPAGTKNADEIKQVVSKSLLESKEQLRRMIAEIERDERRLSFA